jgi:hypothetical protein
MIRLILTNCIRQFTELILDPNVSTRLHIKLPVWPRSVAALALIRFWLRRLASAYFSYIEPLGEVFLNPRFLSILFPATEKPAFRFRCTGFMTPVNTDFDIAQLCPFLCVGTLSLDSEQVVNPARLLQMLCSSPFQVARKVRVRFGFSVGEVAIAMQLIRVRKQEIWFNIAIMYYK